MRVAAPASVTVLMAVLMCEAAPQQRQQLQPLAMSVALQRSQNRTTVPQSFVSVTVDYMPGIGILDLDLEDPSLRWLASRLAPGLLRLGGSAGDLTVFGRDPADCAAQLAAGQSARRGGDGLRLQGQPHPVSAGGSLGTVAEFRQRYRPPRRPRTQWLLRAPEPELTAQPVKRGGTAGVLGQGWRGAAV